MQNFTILPIFLRQIALGYWQPDQELQQQQVIYSKSGSSLSVKSPANANAAPPGYYMLFVINTSGVPSVARIITVQ
ncbi:MAG: galactose oxidase-like domain-containing protein [Trueperaceae bacterium]